MTASVVCFGELLLRLSAPGNERLLQSPHLQAFFGGAECNVAAALSAFGHSAAMVSVLPDSPLGSAALAAVRSLGVDSRFLHTQPGRMGLYFHTQGAMQRASEVIYDRAESSFARAEPALFDWSNILDKASWFHLSGITPAVSERAARSALEAVQTAKRIGIQVSFDCNYRSRVWGSRASQAPSILKELCSHAALLFADDRDLEMVLGTGANVAAAFKQFGELKLIARTRRGVHAVDRQSYGGEIFSRTAHCKSRDYDLSGIVERIGAGDAFAAGILHRLIVDAANLQAAIDFGTAAACYKHSLPGDVCIADVAEIDALVSGSAADIKR